jgi:hypothetical protein
MHILFHVKGLGDQHSRDLLVESAALARVTRSTVQLVLTLLTRSPLLFKRFTTM